MSIDDLMFLLQHPQELTDKHTTELKEALQYAPYCASLRVLYLRSLYMTNNLHYPHERKKTVLFAESPAALAEVVMAEKAEEKKNKRTSQHTGGYFDWVEQIESGESSVTSLKELAGRLRKARESMQESLPSPSKKQTEFNEHDLQTAVKDGNYEQAIVILKQLNLNNQKKISYFADQLRFLEKLVEFSKETTDKQSEIN
ncbi:MAG: hypothetical protein J6V13_02865 [Paludibacteraceae bacterium]|nr:hypothetical protein [Paludibacteraceae bacterium]